MILIHTGYSMVMQCDFPQGFNYIVFAYSVSLVFLFSNFYYQSYLNKRRKDKSAVETKTKSSNGATNGRSNSLKRRVARES